MSPVMQAFDARADAEQVATQLVSFGGVVRDGKVFKGVGGCRANAPFLEGALFDLFVAERDHHLTANDIAMRVLGFDAEYVARGGKGAHMLVVRLRRKLAAVSDSVVIKTYRGEGYRLEIVR